MGVNQSESVCIAGLPPQHLYYSPPDHHAAPSPSAGPKYHENGGGGGGAPGQDNFSDFVSLVCQDGPPGPSRSPKVSVSSYYSPGMYPPPPPMSRPVPLVRSAELATSSPPVSTSTSPGHHPGHHMAGYDIMPPILPPSEHHPPPHDGQSQSQSDIFLGTNQSHFFPELRFNY